MPPGHADARTQKRVGEHEGHLAGRPRAHGRNGRHRAHARPGGYATEAGRAIGLAAGTGRARRARTNTGLAGS